MYFAPKIIQLSYLTVNDKKLTFKLLWEESKMINKKISATVLPLLVSGFYLTSASASQLVDAEMERISPDKESGSGHTVMKQCAEAYKNDGWLSATANIKIKQNETNSEVAVRITNAKANTLYTAWLRIAGEGPGNEDDKEIKIGPNPMNGGGATALLPSTDLDEAILQSPPFNGTKSPKNGFTTDKNGSATFLVNLDFPLIGGAYPFHRASKISVSKLREAGSEWPLVRKPAAIMNPAEKELNAPFMIRIVSHCQDGLAHGLSPRKREPWFQWKGHAAN